MTTLKADLDPKWGFKAKLLRKYGQHWDQYWNETCTKGMMISDRLITIENLDSYVLHSNMTQNNVIKFIVGR